MTQGDPVKAIAGFIRGAIRQFEWHAYAGCDATYARVTTPQFRYRATAVELGGLYGLGRLVFNAATDRGLHFWRTVLESAIVGLVVGVGAPYYYEHIASGPNGTREAWIRETGSEP